MVPISRIFLTGRLLVWGWGCWEKALAGLSKIKKQVLEEQPQAVQMHKASRLPPTPEARLPAPAQIHTGLGQHRLCLG